MKTKEEHDSTETTKETTKTRRRSNRGSDSTKPIKTDEMKQIPVKEGSVSQSPKVSFS